MPRGAFPTSDSTKAFFTLCGVTDGTMNQADIDAGYTKIRVGLAPNKPSEFLEFTVSQYESGYDVSEG
jgi:phage tail sheath protein FI